MVIEQVYLIDVEKSAICAGENAGLKVTFAFLYGLFDIQCSHHAIFRGRDWQVYKRGGTDVEGRILALETFLTFGAPGVGFIWVTAKTAVIHNIDFGKQRSQSARRCGFGGTAFTADQYAADAGIYSIQNERTLHALLSYDGSKGKNGWHVLSTPKDDYNA